MGQTPTTLPLFFFEDTSDGDLSLSLPRSPARGAAAVVKNFGTANTLTVSGNGKLVDGSATFAIAAGDGADFFFNGTQWNVSAAKSQSDQVTLPLPVLDGGTGANLSSANDGDLIAFNSGGGVFAASSIATLGIATTAELSGYVTLQASSPGSADTGGINVSLGGIFGGDVVGSGTGTAAHVAIGSGAGVDATINLTAILPGVVGNVYTVEIVSGAPTPDVALGVVEAGTVTTITLGTDGAGVLDPAKNTAILVLAELGSSTLFTGALAGTGDDSLTVESQIFFGGAEAITAVTGNVAGVGGIFSGNVDAATFSSAGGDPFVLPAADLGGGGALVTDGSGAISVATLAVIGTAVSLQVASPGTPDSGNFNVDGTGIVGGLNVNGPLAITSAAVPQTNSRAPVLFLGNASNGVDGVVSGNEDDIYVSDSGTVLNVFGIKNDQDVIGSTDFTIQTFGSLGSEGAPIILSAGSSGAHAVIINLNTEFGGNNPVGIVLTANADPPPAVPASWVAAATGEFRPAFSTDLQDLGGVSNRVRTFYGGTGIAATALIGSGDNGTVNMVADDPGIAGNEFTVEVVIDAGAAAPMTAAFTLTALLVTLGTAGAGVPDPAKNTATLIRAAINTAAGGVTAAHTGTGADSIGAASGPDAFTGGVESLTLAGGLSANANIYLTNLPGSDPGIAGALYQTAGAVMVSL